MKKKLLLLILASLALPSCTINYVNNDETSTHNNHRHDLDDEEIIETEEEEEEYHPTPTPTPDPDPVDKPMSLDEWQEFDFHDGNEPEINEYWTYYYGTTVNPISSGYYENPNGNGYSGIEMKDVKQSLQSPIFKSYPKVEARFTFWFSDHPSNSKYKASADEPQFKIEEFDSTNKLINTDSFELTKSIIPKTNVGYEKKFYITQSTMCYFNLRFNNFIANGTGGYTAIVCKISLKGWPQV